MKETLQNYLHQQIPLAHSMGIEVKECSERMLILTAPLLINKNDKGTAFGGSLAAALTLAGWAVTYVTLQRLGLEATTLLRRSKIDYMKPIQDELLIIANMPNEASVYRFKQDLLEKGKARWDLGARAETKHELAVDFVGTYVSLSDTLGLPTSPFSPMESSPLP